MSSEKPLKNLGVCISPTAMKFQEDCHRIELPHKFTSVPCSVPVEARQPHALDKAPDKSYNTETMHEDFSATEFLGTVIVPRQSYQNPRQKERPVILTLFCVKL